MTSAISTSSIDVQSIVSQLMTTEQTKTKSIQNKQSSIQQKISAYGQVKNLVSTLKSSLDALQEKSNYNVLAASSSSDAVSLTTKDTAKVGSYKIEVVKKAENEKIRTQGIDPAALFNAGTLHLQFGTYNTDKTNFTVNPANSGTIDIEVKEGDTLKDIQSRINDMNIGVNATVINDGTKEYLSLTSKESGDANQLSITTDAGATGNIQQLLFNTTIQNMTEIQKGDNAQVKVDGLTLSSQNNVFDTAISGVSFTVNKVPTDTATPISVNIAQDPSKVKTLISNFVNSFNSMNRALDTLGKNEAGSSTNGVLSTDTSIKSLKSQMKSILNTDNTDTTLKNLNEIGVSFDKTGALTINDQQLSDALNKNPQNVFELFNGKTNSLSSNGVSERLEKLALNVLGETGKTGLIDGKIESANTMLKTLKTQQERESSRLDKLQKQYTSQYAALDKLLSNMNNTSTMLTSALSKLS